MESGMVDEVKNLHVQGVSWGRLEALGLEYRYIAYFLQDKMDKAEMLEALEKAIWQYARRQRTWFKKYAK
jgi:tRNA dimethylallyltransferase